LPQQKKTLTTEYHKKTNPHATGSEQDLLLFYTKTPVFLQSGLSFRRKSKSTIDEIKHLHPYNSAST
jgi:hypothetical protein